MENVSICINWVILCVFVALFCLLCCVECSWSLLRWIQISFHNVISVNMLCVLPPFANSTYCIIAFCTIGIPSIQRRQRFMHLCTYHLGKLVVKTIGVCNLVIYTYCMRGWKIHDQEDKSWMWRHKNTPNMEFKVSFQRVSGGATTHVITSMPNTFALFIDLCHCDTATHSCLLQETQRLGFLE